MTTVDQPGLFTPAPPKPDTFLCRNWLRDHRRALAVLTNTLPWEQRRLREQPMPRLECWLSSRPGATYKYSGVEYVAQDLADYRVLAHLLQVVGDAMEANYGQRPDSVFANLYRTGKDSIGWHSDDEPALGPVARVVIASLSLGAHRKFAMKSPEGVRCDWLLGEGDLLIMGPGCQSGWLHSVPKTTKPVGSRLNLTFRKLRRGA